jgi:hypothetical protein
VKKARYNHKLTGAEQVDMEEKIAALIFDHSDVQVDDETAADLGRNILHEVLKRFRPDFFTHTVVKNRK